MMRVRRGAIAVGLVAAIAASACSPKQHCDSVADGAPASTLLEKDYYADKFCQSSLDVCGPSGGPCRVIPDAGSYFLRVGPTVIDNTGTVYGCCVHVVDGVIDYKTVRDEP